MQLLQLLPNAIDLLLVPKTIDLLLVPKIIDLLLVPETIKLRLLPTSIYLRPFISQINDEYLLLLCNVIPLKITTKKIDLKCFLVVLEKFILVL